MRVYFTLFLVIFFLAIAFIFGSQNDQIIRLNYIIAGVDISVAAAVSLFTSVGIILGLLFCLLWKLLSRVTPTKSNDSKKVDK